MTGFYTTSLFKLERQILKWVISRPSTDAQATQLAAGEIDTFAAWHVEARADNQILMCDFRNRTRLWLMVAPLFADGDARTILYFGSAVIPVRRERNVKARMGWPFSALIGFHTIYSQALLYFAKKRLQSRGSDG